MTSQQRGQLDRLLTNQASDGSFFFIRNQPFEDGHPALCDEANQGAMFPTWFRLLSLALIGQALPVPALGKIPWRFVHCPGLQFWGGAEVQIGTAGSR